jgi:Ca-activated chloride channel family protein
VIILITDGLEACDNDPCVIAKKLHDKGVKVTPFVIGLGLDLSYLEQFKCIGSYTEAETKDAFRTVLGTVISKALINTTIQINLNNINGVPVETDVTLLLFEAGTKRLVYTFEHTLDRLGNPDTVVMDPNLKYDMIVNTIPKVEVKNIVLKKNTHNIITANTPQGFLRFRYSNATKGYAITARITQPNNPLTLNTQQIGGTDKYIVGTYQVELLTLPRIYKTVEITQSSTTTIDVPAPGLLSYSCGKAIVGGFRARRERKHRMGLQPRSRCLERIMAIAAGQLQDRLPAETHAIDDLHYRKIF